MIAYGVGKDGKVHPNNEDFVETFICGCCKNEKMLIERSPKPYTAVRKKLDGMEELVRYPCCKECRHKLDQEGYIG